MTTSLPRHCTIHTNPSLLAGAKYQGEFEERMQGVLRDVKNLPDVRATVSNPSP